MSLTAHDRVMTVKITCSFSVTPMCLQQTVLPAFGSTVVSSVTTLPLSALQLGHAACGTTTFCKASHVQSKICWSLTLHKTETFCEAADPLSRALQDDFECDFGYERRNGTCIRMTGISSDDCEQISSGQYYVSETHLRLIHNDSCLHVERVVTDSDGHGTCVGPHCNGNSGKGRGALGKFFIFLLVSCPWCWSCCFSVWPVSMQVSLQQAGKAFAAS